MDYRDAFLNLLAILAYVDMDFAPQERQRIADKLTELYGDEAAEALRRLQNRFDEITDFEAINRITRESVETIKLQRPQNEWKNVIRELILLAFADKKVDVSESAYLVNICRQFGLNLDEVISEFKNSG